MATDGIDKISYRIDEAVKASGLGRSFLYEKMAEGALRSVKVGGRRLILRRDLLAFIDGGSSGYEPAPQASPVAPEAKVGSRQGGGWAQLELPLKGRK